MKKLPSFLAGAFGFCVVLLLLSAFTVQETQHAIVLQFGRPVRIISTAGLYFHVPVIQNVRYFDKRILSVDPGIDQMTLSADKDDPLLIKNSEVAPETKAELQKLTNDSGGMPIKVEVYARYKIIDPLLFMQRLVNEDGADLRLRNVMNGATRDVLGATTLRELLSPKRNEIMQAIKTRVNKEMAGRGVNIIDIRIVRADLTDRLLASTVSRMITENKERATKTRAMGHELALQIRAEADKEKTVLLADAQKKSQILRGEGDSQAIKIYNAAYNKDQNFYNYMRTLEAYRKVLATPDTRLILSPGMTFLNTLEKPPEQPPVPGKN